MAPFQIILEDGKRHDADLHLLQKYSKYYQKGFSGRFVETDTSYLKHAATKYTVTKLLAVIKYLEAVEWGDADTDDLFPLQWSNEEHWDELFDLWLLADYLYAEKIQKFVEDYMRDKIISPGEGHRALTTPEFNFFWQKLDVKHHKSLQDVLITAIMAAPEFSSSKSSRTALLDHLPADAERAIVHALMDRMAESRNLVQEIVSEVTKEREELWSWGWSSAFHGLMTMFNSYPY